MNAASKLKTLLIVGENLNIEFKRASDGPRADTFESVCAFLNKAISRVGPDKGGHWEVVG